MFLEAVGQVIDRLTFPTTEEGYDRAKDALFDYVEVFYNQRRRHSTLGQISPAEFERCFTAA